MFHDALVPFAERRIIKMKNLKAIIILSIVCALTAGCTGRIGMLAVKKSEYNEGENKMSNERESVVSLTPEQEELLRSMSVDEQRIKEGKLYNWQKEVLKQREVVLEYLNRKYPSHTFEIVSCSPQNQTHSDSEFWYKADGNDRIFEMYLETDEKGYICQDNFYGFLLKKSYEETLFSILKKDVPECVTVVSQISSLKGLEYDETLTAQKILESHEKLTNLTTILAKGEQGKAEEIVGKIEDVIQKNQIYGGYVLGVLKVVPDTLENSEDILEYVKEQGDDIYLLKKNFQQFD